MKDATIQAIQMCLHEADDIDCHMTSSLLTGDDSSTIDTVSVTSVPPSVEGGRIITRETAAEDRQRQAAGFSRAVRIRPEMVARASARRDESGGLVMESHVKPIIGSAQMEKVEVSADDLELSEAETVDSAESELGEVMKEAGRNNKEVENGQAGVSNNVESTMQNTMSSSGGKNNSSSMSTREAVVHAYAAALEQRSKNHSTS